MEQRGRRERKKKEVKKIGFFFRWGIFLNIMIHDPWRGTFVYGSEVVCKKEKKFVIEILDRRLPTHKTTIRHNSN